GKRIAKNSDVSSSMIWGCQWDRTLEWLVARNGGNYSLVMNSEDWGNHMSTTFEYLDTDGTTKTKGTDKPVPTGSTERNKKNNIYDMAGNVFDWTLEANNTSYRISRRRPL
ncbi:MAG: SUMF1/EgtB/PvdO family nonheme iron enzyme, partial [Clostridia bacterium]|nr:SUMF1/EgtB/PvdO family nonheme iron enzyme [Clostridia bacterium]